MKRLALITIAAFVARASLAIWIEFTGHASLIAPDTLGYATQGAAWARGDTAAEMTHFGQIIGTMFILPGRPYPALLIVCLFGALYVPVAWLLGHWLGFTDMQRTVGGIVVGFWPSSVLWSSQLLKDSVRQLTILMVLTGLVGVAYNLKPRTQVSKVRLISPVAVLVAGLIGCWWVVPGWTTGATQITVYIPSLGRIVTTDGQYGLVPLKNLDYVPIPTDACPHLGGLIALRLGYQRTPGNTAILEPAVTCGQILRYVPRAIELSLFAPIFANAPLPVLLESIPAKVAGCGFLLFLWRHWRRPSTWVVTGYVLSVSWLLGMVAANFGTLYRYRLIVLLPFLFVSFCELARRENWVKV